MIASSRFERTYTLRSDPWRTRDTSPAGPTRVLSALIIAITAACTIGVLHLREMRSAEPTEMSVVAADIPPPTSVPLSPAVAPVAPAAIVARVAPAPVTATPPKKKHAVKEDPTRRALAELRRAQLERAASDR